MTSIIRPERVAARSLGLAAVVCRETMEAAANEPKAAQMQGLVLRWIERASLASGLNAKEIEILEAPLGSLERADRALAFWRADQLSILAWALGKIPLPSPWERYPGRWVARRVGFLRDDADAIVRHARLVPARYLAQYSVIAEKSLEQLREAMGERPSDGVAGALCAVEQRLEAISWLIGERELGIEPGLSA